MGKAKSDKLETGLSMIPYHSVMRLGRVFVEGLRYGRDNWKQGVNDEEYQRERLEHAMRHLMLWTNGDRTEDHLAKVMWFCATQLELERLENQSQKETAMPSEEELARSLGVPNWVPVKYLGQPHTT